mmetsp:Transcript_44724/g.83529  ORF Transcript_44724/g.83529 Transcript_44724/m.83529 type:complete len:108 (+) Transcript_44724:895-1218(+)
MCSVSVGWRVETSSILQRSNTAKTSPAQEPPGTAWGQTKIAMLASIHVLSRREAHSLLATAPLHQERRAAQTGNFHVAPSQTPRLNEVLNIVAQPTAAAGGFHGCPA